MNKKTILYYGDSPLAPTGFGQVTRNIYEALKDEYNFEFVGLNNNNQEYDRTKYFIHNFIGHDPQAPELFRILLAKGDYDIVFVLYNHEFLYQYSDLIRKDKPCIHYSPFDMSVKCLSFDHWKQVIPNRVYYNEYSKNLVDDKDGVVINHGTNPDIYKRISREEKLELRESLGITKEDFIVLNVNHNQWRKDFGSSIIAFCNFSKDNPDSTYLIHANGNDMGGSLKMQIHLLREMYNPKAKIVLSDHNRYAFPDSEIVKLYQAADCFLTTSMGEGHGLTTTEAMCVGLPVIAPDNTSFKELLADDRGFLCDIDRFIIPYGNSDYPYPIVKVEDVTKKLLLIYNKFRPNSRFNQTDQSMSLRTYCEKQKWSNIQKQWRDYFKKIIQN
jgi:glycosyltransferase involved in cell wall biosynthesis